MKFEGEGRSYRGICLRVRVALAADRQGRFTSTAPEPHATIRPGAFGVSSRVNAISSRVGSRLVVGQAGCWVDPLIPYWPSVLTSRLTIPASFSIEYHPQIVSCPMLALHF